jgi:hypothetical protein
MTPQSNIPSCLARFGVLGLATATVVTGLTLSPTTPAVAQPAPATTQEAAADTPASPADTPASPADTPASPVGSSPVHVSSSTPIEIAAVAAPVITKSTKYVNTAGKTIYRFEGNRVAGATVNYNGGAGFYLGSQTFPSDTTFILETDFLRGDTFWLRQTVNGVNSATTVINASDLVTEVPVVRELGASFYERTDGTKRYTYTGTGVAGAAIEFKQGSSSWVAGGTAASNGTFSFDTGWTATASNPIQIRQSIGTQISTAVDAPLPGSTAQVPVVRELGGTFIERGDGTRRSTYTGTGVAGSTIEFKQGSSDWVAGGTANSNGTFSFQTGWVATTQNPIQIRQRIGTQISAAVDAPLPTREENVSLPFVMESPSVGDTFTPGTATFTGTGTSGSTITVTPQRGLAPVTTTVKEDGRWSVTKYLGNGTYVFDIAQTSPTGAPQGVINAFIYAPTGSNVDRNFEMITPRIGDSFTPDSFVHFVGQGTPGATITLKPQAGLSEATAIVGDDGFWKIRRGMGNGTYIFSATQTVGGVVTGKPIVGFVYGPTVDGDPITRPFAVTSHASGGTFTPNTTVAINGTGTPNATVTLKPQGNLREQTVPVSRDGYWVAPRGMGNGAYTFTITQMLDGKVVGTPITDFVLTPAQ